jgi:inner membrane protein
MDNLTHSLVGALIGQAGLKRKTGLAMPALIIGANIPDVDAACLLWLDGVEHVGFRRGITHGPIAWVLLPLVLAGLLYGYDRWQAKRGKRPERRLPVHFGWLYALSFIACLTHPAMDWLNVYGIRLLEPFSHRWFYGDVLFIVDVWLWLGMGFATWFSLRREKRGGEWRWPARTGLALSLAYIGWNFATSASAELYFAINNKVAGNPHHVSYETLIASPTVFDPRDRDIIAGRKNDWFVRRQGDSAPRPITAHRCAWPDVETLMARSPQLKAFLFWSRAPFVERHPSGKGIVFQDARFYDPLSRGRFSVEFPDVECREPEDI